MTVTIKLDASAIRELFPEGSEARLELSRAVVAETIRKMDTKIIGQMTKVMTDEMKPVLDEMSTKAKLKARDLLESKGYSWILSENTKQQIEQTVNFMFSDRIESIVKARLETIVASQKTVDEKLAYVVDTKLKSSDAYISQKANQLLAAKIDAIINNVMEKQ